MIPTFKRDGPLTFLQFTRARRSHLGHIPQRAAQRLHKRQELLRRVDAGMAHQQVFFHGLDLPIGQRFKQIPLQNFFGWVVIVKFHVFTFIYLSAPGVGGFVGEVGPQSQ